MTCPKPCYTQACVLCAEKGHSPYTCREKVCQNCFLIGHTPEDCKSKHTRKCQECRRPEHKASHCVVRTERLHRNEMKDITCSVCREIGHVSCVVIKTFSKSLYCSRCGNKGHKRRDCRHRR